MTKLLIQTPDGRKATLDLTDKRLKLGRAEWCDFVLRNDAEVSREHAQIWLDDQGRILVEDMQSKNGTRVDDGEAFRGARQVATHSIRIGEHQIEIVGAPPRPAKARTPAPTFIETVPAGIGDTQFFPSTRKLELDLNRQRLDHLMQLTERIGGVFERKQLLEQALDACCDALRFERGLIALKTQRGDTELPVSRNVQRDENGAFKISRTLINRALVDGEQAIVNNPATDLVGNLTESLVRFPINSALCVPILYRSEILGVIYGDRVTTGDGEPYMPEDVDFLAAIAQQVGVGLANLRLFQEHLQAQKVFAELQAARGIQQRLLPAKPLEIGRVRIEGYNEASSAVSGDYFDYFDLGDGRAGIIIADVAGHGLPAAMVMANIQSAVRVALTGQISLPELAERINRLICLNTGTALFVTAILGIVDAHTGVFEYVGAGHPPPISLARGKATPLTEENNSLFLGYEHDETYHVQRIEPADNMAGWLLYTDGVNEATDRDGSLLGIQPVVRALGELNDITADNMIRVARNVVRQHLDGVPIADDLTLLAIQLKRT